LLSVNWLGELGTSESLPLLREILGFRQYSVLQRISAAFALGRQRDREAIPLLRQVLRDEASRSPALAGYVALALGEMHVREAAPELAPLLERRSTESLELFLRAAKELADPSLGLPLLAILKEEKIKDYHGWAAAAASSCASPEVIKEFERMALATDKIEGTPSYVLHWLSVVPAPEAQDALIRVATSDRPAAREAISCLGMWPAREDETSIFGSTSSTRPLSAKALEVLSKIAADAKSPPATRAAAVKSIGQRKMPETRDLMERFLGDPASSVRLEAISALTELPPARTPAGLPACLRDTSPTVVNAAVKFVRKWNLRDQSDGLLDLKPA
jgi:HEAT repeat protein